MVKRARIWFLMALWVVFSSSVGLAQTLSVASATVDVDQTVEVNIVLDQAPNGISGFGLRVFLDNGTVADIDDFEIGSQFLAVTSPTSDIASDKKSALIGGLDLGQVETGTTNVELVTITFRGRGGGESKIRIEVLSLVGDDNQPLNVQLQEGTLTVSGAPAGPDQSPPQFNSFQPSDGSTIRETQPVISVRISDTGSGVDEDSIQLNLIYGGQSERFSLSDREVIWDGQTFTVPLTEANVTLFGTVDVDLLVRDRSGNVGNTTWQFTVSSDQADEAPFVTLNIPTNGATVAVGDVEFNFIITDDEDEQIAFILLIDGQSQASGNSPNGLARTQTVPGLSEGTHTWQVQATDSEGNTTLSQERRFTVGQSSGGGEAGIAAALDTDGSGFLEDSEIVRAIQLWILGEPVSGTAGLTIDDGEILKLIQMWILATPVS